jgi:hypothetical protein
VIKHRSLYLGSWLVVAVLLAGCGGSSSSIRTATSLRSQATTPVSSTTAGGASGIMRSAELSACSATAARSRLSSSGQSQYVRLCRKAIDGGDASVKAAAERLCRSIIKRTVPAAAFATLTAYCPKP